MLLLESGLNSGSARVRACGILSGMPFFWVPLKIEKPIELLKNSVTIHFLTGKSLEWLIPTAFFWGLGGTAHAKTNREFGF